MLMVMEKTVVVVVVVMTLSDLHFHSVLHLFGHYHVTICAGAVSFICDCVRVVRRFTIKRRLMRVMNKCAPCAKMETILGKSLVDNITETC